METFIQDEDYNVAIRSQILNLLVQEDPLAREDAEMAAQEEMESYLRVRYDVGLIFSLDQAIADRKKIIVMYMCDIALYHLHSNITPDNIPEIRFLRYERAVKWLEKVAASNLSPDLPEYEDADNPFPNGGSQFFEGGSNEKVTERY